jgi:hypothetical protein
MKKLYILFMLISSLCVHAQNAELCENSWSLTHLVLDGIDIQPPSNAEVPTVPLLFSNEESAYSMSTNVCNYAGGTITFGGIADTFSYETLAVSLIICSNPVNTGFENSYLHYFYLGNAGAALTYTVTTSGDAKTLTITAPNSDHAIYSNQSMGNPELPVIASKIYPNPASDFIHVDLPNNLTMPVLIEIYDTLGKLRMQENFAGTLNNLNVRNLNSGLYLLKIKVGNTIKSYKFIKQ